MKKKWMTGILAAVLVLILAAGGLMASHLKKEQAREEAARIEQEAIEEEKKQQAQKEAQERKEAEEREQKAEAEEQEQAQEAAEEVVSVLEEEEEASETSSEEAPQTPKEEGTPALGDLKAQVEGMVAGYEGDYSVYVYNLDTDEYMEINSHPVKAASLIKLYIMGAVLEQISAGNLTGDDSLHQLLVNMITVSDNESSNELVRRLSADGTNHEEGMTVVNAFANAYGYGDTSQGRDLRDYREVPAEGENYTSVRDCALFLKRVYEGTNVSEEASAVMLDLLKQQTRTWKIPAGVPEGVVTANKTGELSDTENDVAIIYSEGADYILCVTSTGLTNPGGAQANIASISSTVYQYFNG